MNMRLNIIVTIAIATLGTINAASAASSNKCEYKSPVWGTCWKEVTSHSGIGQECRNAAGQPAVYKGLGGIIVANPTSQPCGPEQPDPKQFVSTRYYDTCEYRNKAYVCQKKSAGSAPAGQPCKNNKGEIEKWGYVEGRIVEKSTAPQCK